MTLRSQKSFLYIFFVSLGLPLLFMIFGIKSLIKTSENRNLAAPPPFKRILKSDFFASLDSYLKDHFGLRAEFLSLGWVQVKFLNSSTTDQVLFGKEGWLFYRGYGNIDDYRNKIAFKESELENWKTYLKKGTDESQKIGARFFFMLAPNSHTIYGDKYLPQWVTKLSPTSRADQLKEKAEKEGFSFIDPREILLKNRDQYTLYHKTDTHWTEVGAYFAYVELMKILGLRPSPLSQFQIEWRGANHLDLTGLLGPFSVPEEFQSLRPLKPRKATYQEVDANHFVSFCDSCGNLRAVFFHDSFMEALHPFISEHFAEVHYINKKQIDWALVGSLKPHYIVKELVERDLLNWTPTL